MCAKLKEIIPRQMVQIAIQAVVNGKVMGRETLKAFRKDVTAKLVNKFVAFGGSDLIFCFFSMVEM